METKKYRYSVALSFSGKQRSYVERVSKELTRLGIQHFYDFNEQEDLWGKDLSRYLDKLYFEDAKYFVPFVSKDYVETVWPNLELSSALDRNMNELRPDYQRYILPVYFDDIRIHGISKSIGYYDANKISPEKLAEAIYKKLKLSGDVESTTTSHPQPNVLPNESNSKIEQPKSKLLKSLHTNYLAKLHAIFDSNLFSQVVVVYGEKGLGKRSCIVEALSHVSGHRLFRISPSYENHYQYASIIQSLKLDVAEIHSQSDLDFGSYIRYKMLSVCTENPSIIYVEHFHEFDEVSRALLYEAALYIITRYLDRNICMLIEFDTDTTDSIIEPFYELIPNQTEFIRFERLSAENIKRCFFHYCGDIEISEENLNYIVRSSSGNILYLTVIINYLRGAGHIGVINGRLTCSRLPNGALSDVLRKYLLLRYERLDPVLKELLSKSSMIGNIFRADLLERPFQIINADEKLANIEKISNLIARCTDQTYIFETDDVYNLIRSSIPEEQQREWHNILAHYFQEILRREEKRKLPLAVEKRVSYIYPIAKHFQYAMKYHDALVYYLKLIPDYAALCDYNKGLEIVHDIQYILQSPEFDTDSFDGASLTVQLAEADCYRGLGNYTAAYELYKDTLTYIDPVVYSKTLIDINCHMAYCQYMTGKVDEAQRALQSICHTFNLAEDHREDYIHIISLLASMCDATSDFVTQKQYYIEALTYYRENRCETEYYGLLRMASMVFDEVLALDMEKAAEKYFRENHSIRMLAETLHNIATDELYLLQEQDILLHLNESISLFDAFGSKAVHYPLNTKGIVQMVICHNYHDAVSTFHAALQMSTEPYSEITIRTNIVHSLIQLNRFNEAYQQLQIVDNLIKKEAPEDIPVYDTFHFLNWAFYYFHQKDYRACETCLKKLKKLPNIESRHVFIAKSLGYILKKVQGQRTRNTAGIPPYPVYRKCVEDRVFFATLRFYE